MRWLFTAYAEIMEPEGDGPVGLLFWIAAFVGFVVGVVAAITTGLFGAALYHEAHGSTTSAVVTSVGATNGGLTGRRYHVVDQRTGNDLGWLAQAPRDETVEGDVIEVSVDPHGWLPPMPVDSLGGTTAPGIVLVCCLGVMGLATLAVVVAGFCRYVAEASRRR